jgi:hypothetical protein
VLEAIDLDRGGCEMFEQRRWPRLPWLAIAAGLLWLWWSAQAGIATFVLTLPAGALLLASGIGLLLWPGDHRITQTQALAGVLGVILSLPAAIALGLGSALVLALLSAAAFAAAGATAVHQEPHTENVPEPRPSLSLSAQVGLDEAVLGFEQLAIALPAGDATHRVAHEIRQAQELFASRGWIEKPVDYHQTPPPLEHAQIQHQSSLGLRFEHLSFESLYEPHAEEPGRDRWLGYAENRRAHAYLLRHGDDSRPWLVCNNGYRMGRAALDTRIFARYWRDLGLNVLIPVLPFHGPRRIGLQSGQGFLGGEPLDTVHAEAQAMWDIRRLLGWVRERGAPLVGTYGLSLGGYTTALLACLADELACVIAGIPLADLSRILWRHGPKLQLEYLKHVGIAQSDLDEVFRVVSPLAMKPRAPREARMLFGGVADRLVTPDHVCDLWEHWERPHVVWAQSGHMTFALDSRVEEGIEAVLRSTELID